MLQALEPPGIIDFMTRVKPILESSCVRCHGAARAEDEVAIDTREAASAYIVPGSSAASELYTVLVLPDHDKRAMPIRDRDQLSDEQIAIIKGWIDGGAPWPDGLVLQPVFKVQFSSVLSTLQTNCTVCHAQGHAAGGLRLDDRRAAHLGGRRGPAFRPFAPAESPLLTVLLTPAPHHRPKFLDPEHIAELRTWIEQGAVWPAAFDHLAVPARKASAGPAAP